LAGIARTTCASGPEPITLISRHNDHFPKERIAAQLCSARGNDAEPVRTVGSVVRSDNASKRRVEQVTGLPFMFDLAVA
jgi:hypothetical protein